MAFDAGMLACVLNEIKELALGGRIEKIMQPERDEILLQMRSNEGGKRLLINAGSNTPRVCFTTAAKENPAQAPMLCMLLRKHLTGSKLAEIRQPGFERVAIFGFDGHDEMGFECRKYLIAEIMGKYSNLIFADGNMKVISVLKPVDFSTSSLRQILPGMIYELPPKQDKLNPLEVTKEQFFKLYNDAPAERSCDKFITSTFLGIASSVAREIVYNATRHTDTPIGYCTCEDLWESFDKVIGGISRGEFSPCAVFDGSKPIEYAFTNLAQYTGYIAKRFESPSELLDTFFSTRDREDSIRRRAADILRLLTNAESRITKKLEAQKAELEETEHADIYRRYGDMITSGMRDIPKGAASANLTDYEDWHDDGTYGKVQVPLDPKMSAAANAQKYYKKYNKSKTANVILTDQILLDKEEIEYIHTVFDSLTRAETERDLAEIRDELYRSGYASKMRDYKAGKKMPDPAVAKYKTSGGYLVLCGKNNIQNEYITHKLASRDDWWFHAKKIPGSHVVMVCNGEEPGEVDFTEAAEIAAYNSGAKGGAGVEVDYLKVRNVKRVAGARPGFVIYHTNWSAYVTPDEEKIKKMRV